MEFESGDVPTEIPVTEELDLHTFRPSEVSSLLPEYFRECRIKGVLRVRVVHGKGTGTLKEGVVALLQQLPEVAEFSTAGAGSGGWGATWVYLRPWDANGEEQA